MIIANWNFIKFRKYLPSALLCSFFLLPSLFLSAQQNLEKGLPFINNYLAKDYQASPQNWAIIEDNRGIMYFGNSYGLLEYDGVKWRKITLGVNSIVRALGKDKNGRIYYGGYSDFGYVRFDSLGQTKLHSLSSFVPAKYKNFNDVWSVYAADEGVYFQSRERIFRLSQKNDGNKENWDVKVWDSPNKFMYSFYNDDTFYVHQQGVGLLKMVKDSLVLIAGSEFMGNERVQTMLPYPDSTNAKKYLFGLFYGGLYMYDGKKFSRFVTESDSLIKGNTLYKGIQLQDGSYALATAGKGLCVMDRDGKVLQLLNREVGLQDESVYAVYTDDKGALWIGLDNGISRIETASPFTQFAVQSGITTATITASRFKGVMYTGTTNGLLRFNSKKEKFEPVKKVPTNQVFSLVPDEDVMLVSTDGLYGIKNNEAHRIKNSVAGDLLISALTIYNKNPNILLAGLSGGLAMFDKIGNSNAKGKGVLGWHFTGVLPNMVEDVWSFAEESDGTMWAGTQTGVLRLTNFVDTFGKPTPEKTAFQKYGTNDGLSEGAVFVGTVKNKVFFVSNSSVFTFDSKTNRFIRDNTFGDMQFGNDPNQYVLTTDDKGRVWINFGKETALAIPKKDGGYRTEKTPFLPITDRVISKIYPEKNGIVWFATTDGLIRYDENLQKDYDEPFETVIRNVIAEKQVLNVHSKKEASLKYNQSTLRFEYAAPFYEQEKKTQYQTWLEGFDKGWSDWDGNSYKEYTNLGNGKYHFHVRAKNVYNKIGEEAIYHFTIQPPWYNTWWAYLLYALAAGSLIYAVVRFRTEQLKVKHRQLEKVVSERTQQLSERIEELAVINSVQESLVAQRSLQAIYDLVGDKIRQIFNAQIIDIVSYDRKSNIIEDRYAFEKGDKTLLGPREPAGFRKHVIETKQVLLINHDIQKKSEEFKNVLLVGEVPKSAVFVPMLGAGEVTGIISLQDLDHENFFSDADISLITTLANSMSVALESARLFDETSRLLKETEQRNAELAVINSVQEGLVAQMDLQGIYDLVGDKIKNIFNAQVVVIRTFNHKEGLEEYWYVFEKGERLHSEPRALTWESRELIRTGQPILINKNYFDEAQQNEQDGEVIPVVGEMPKSALFVPMMVGNTVIGSLSIQHIDSEEAFDNSDLRLLTTLANSMSVALENARLFDETKLLLKETENAKKNVELLSGIGKEITASLEFETIFYKLYENINQLADATIFGVGIYHPEKQEIEYKFAVEKGKRYAPYSRNTSDKNQFPVWCIENRGVVFINDVNVEYSKYIEGYKEKDLFLEDGTLAEEPESLIYLPLMVQDRVLGIITIQSFNKNAYTHYHLNLLQNLATYTGIALDNANAYKKLNEREQEIALRAAELSTVNSISRALASKIEVEALIKLVGDNMRQLFKADIVYVALLDKKTNIINFPYQCGDDLTPFELGEGLTSKVILSGEPLLINRDVEWKTEQLGVQRLGVPAASYIGVPIPVGEEIIGVLSVQSTKEENCFDEKDQRLLSTIAAHVGVALRKARLFEEVKQAKMEAEAASKTAEKANEAKSAFLSTVSHELRTPLTSVLGFAKIIKKRLEEKIFPSINNREPRTVKTIEQVSENLNVVIAEGERLTHLINDVLDLAKIEAGKMEWNMEPVNISEVVERSIAATSALLDQKHLTLEKNIEDFLPEVTGDRDKLIQVVVNLLSNAIKFTDDGSVFCNIYHQDNEIIVSVTDTGIGIAPGDHAAVFEQFKQVGGDTLTDKPKGTGLGLPICKEIVEHHGGRIWLESESGKGSTFSFALPVTKSRDVTPIHLNDLVKQLKQQMKHSKLAVKGSNATILIVDDDESIRSLLRQELNEAGYEIEEAANGKEALLRIRNKRPDLIILDIMMPEMNGFDVAAILKNDPQTMEIPIIVLSIIQDKARGYRIGVDRYLTKPIDTPQLFAEVGALLEQGKSKKKVMVVDEDGAAVLTLKEVLQTKGYAVVESDGKEMVKKAIANQPDIIILNSILSANQEMVQSLRFEKGLENVLFLIYQ